MTDGSPKNIDVSALRQAGLQHFQAGQFGPAIAAFQGVLNHDQRDPISWSALAASLEQIGELDNASISYRNALKLDPKSFQSAHQLGRLHIKLKDAGQAVARLQQALDINPASEAARCDLGTAHMLSKDTPSAVDSFRQALAQNPNFQPALIGLGKCLREQLRSEEALEVLESAVQLNPRSTDALTTLASALSDEGLVDQAIEFLDSHMKAYGDDVVCHQTKALILLRYGRLEPGFREYEWRLYPTSLGVAARPFTSPRWTGDSLKDRSLLVWLEQGIGDEILSLSLWAPQLRRGDTGSYIVECDPRLVGLVSRAFPLATVIPRTNPPGQAATDADVSCPAWSGATILPQDHATTTPYLIADPHLTSQLRQKYEALAQGKKIVGLSWRSTATHGHLKTPPVEAWHPLLSDSSLFVVCIQYDPSEADITTLSMPEGSTFHIDSSIDAKSDLEASAAQIASLDAVVTISNSTAHLSGALGVPTATVLPSGYGSFWYWFRERSDSPWYSSMRLCRQKRPGEWQSAIDSASVWLNEL